MTGKWTWANPPAEAFPPCDFLREELAERGWSVEELADRAVLPVADVAALVAGTRGITARHSERLSVALGTSAEYWQRLQVAWNRRQMGREARR